MLECLYKDNYFHRMVASLIAQKNKRKKHALFNNLPQGIDTYLDLKYRTRNIFCADSKSARGF